MLHGLFLLWLCRIDHDVCFSCGLRIRQIRPDAVLARVTLTEYGRNHFIKEGVMTIIQDKDNKTLDGRQETSVWLRWHGPLQLGQVLKSQDLVHRLEYISVPAQK